MAASKFVRAAAELLQILGTERSALAGGMAVNAYGFVRATRDVDVLVVMPLAEARRRLRAAGVEARLFTGDRLEGDFSCLKGVLGVGPRKNQGVPFDVLPELVPFSPGEAVELVVGGERLRVVDPDTLLRLKLKAGSAKNLYDVAILANLHPDWGERAIALATVHGADLSRRVAGLVQDPRVRAQAREVRRQEAALRAFAKGRRKRRGPARS